VILSLSSGHATDTGQNNYSETAASASRACARAIDANAAGKKNVGGVSVFDYDLRLIG
jgi:hypothetical protein